jgi:hypothetical protein
VALLTLATLGRLVLEVLAAEEMVVLLELGPTGLLTLVEVAAAVLRVLPHPVLTLAVAQAALES